jgi:hypothetical protein
VSAEPRRIKRIIKRSPRPLTEGSGTTLAPHQISVSPGPSLPKEKPEKALTFAVSKVRVIDGYVTLPQLAHERGIQAQLARLWVKATGIKKPGDRWMWKEDSKALKRVREALGLKP